MYLLTLLTAALVAFTFSSSFAATDSKAAPKDVAPKECKDGSCEKTEEGKK